MDADVSLQWEDAAAAGFDVYNEMQSPSREPSGFTDLPPGRQLSTSRTVRIVFPDQVRVPMPQHLANMYSPSYAQQHPTVVLERNLPIGEAQPEEEKKGRREEMTQATRDAREKHVAFLESATWLAIRSIIISFFTSRVLNLILQWRSGTEVFVLMVAVCALWWTVIQDQIKILVLDDYDRGSNWWSAVIMGLQLVTTSIFLITGQYASQIVLQSWEAQSLSVPDTIAYLVVVLFLVSDFVFMFQEGEKIRKRRS